MTSGRTMLSVSVAVATGIALSVFAYSRPEMIARHPMLPVDFVHADHIEVGCIDCHHNYSDDTGQGLCYACHKEDPAIAAQMEAMFHELCRGCHVEKALAGEDGGPVRVCEQCHHPNDAFM